MDIEFTFTPQFHRTSYDIAFDVATVEDEAGTHTHKIVCLASGMKQIFHIAAIGFCV
jgi:hypothetical protein